MSALGWDDKVMTLVVAEKILRQKCSSLHCTHLNCGPLSSGTSTALLQVV